MTASATRFRWRLVTGCVLLMAVAMIQSPGFFVPDTKLDLVVSPLEFLARTSHLWDDEGFFGQVQNQAYGYLWPMGPFFVLGSLLDVPGWVIQRLWLALVMGVAFVGTAKLARAMGVRSDVACLVAGFAFALSPRMLTVLGSSSIEAWPSALAPWVLLPLVLGARQGSPRRAAALSAVAVAMVGGVNAAATSAVLPLGALWLLTREPGPRRRQMMIWWPLFTLLATLWWLIPLFLLGSYSPPFLDFIESATTTTLPTNLVDSLRGTSNWVAYVDSSARAGNDLLRNFYLPLNAAVIAVAGIVGMLLPRNPHRLFLALGVGTGLVMVSMGHMGSVEGLFAPQLQHLLDGVLAPLRNVHKFDVVIRLPMLLGLAWAVDALVAAVRDRTVAREERWNCALLTGFVVFAVVVTTTPALVGRITPTDGYADIPEYWSEAAQWLAKDGNDSTALLLPGTMFPTYVWGSPGDEPFQPLAESKWAVRNAIPLTPVGNIRMLDAIEERIAQGRGSAGLSQFMRRNGIGYLVVRNDLVRGNDIPDPVLVHQALEQTPGVEIAQTFGPVVGGSAHLVGDVGRTLINGGWQNDYAAIEIYQLTDRTESTVAASTTPVVVGAPEDVLDLIELGVIDDELTQLAADLEPGADLPGPVILTDGYPAVSRTFGRLHAATTEVLTRDKMPDPQGSSAPDYLLGDNRRWSTFAEYDGITGVRASSSLASPGNPGGSRPERLPFAAVDGRSDTFWESQRLPDPEHWWEIELEEDGLPETLRVTAPPGAGEQQIQVITDDWVSDSITLPAGAGTTVAVGDDSSPTVRVADSSGRTASPLQLAEVSWEGLSAARRLVVPEVPEQASAPAAVVLRARYDDRSGCVTVDGQVRCVPGREIAGEESRGFGRRVSMPSSATYDGELLVRGHPSDELAALIQQAQLADVTSSSAGVADARASVLAAVDGNPGTTWIASIFDIRPSITVRWLTPQRINGLSMSVDPNTAARLPETLTLTSRQGERSISLDEDGSATFAPLTTSELTLEVGESEPAVDLAFSGATSAVPVGITDLSLRGTQTLPMRISDEPLDLSCGSGPQVRVNGTTLDTRVTASPLDLMSGRTVPARLCGEMTLTEGDNLVDVLPHGGFTPHSLVLQDDAGDAALSAAAASVTPLDSDDRGAGESAISAPPGAGYVATTDNTNPGWQATEGGRTLDAIIVDGWRQGWKTSDDVGQLDVSFRPNATYRVGMVVGLLTLLSLLIGLGIFRRRPAAAHLAPLGERRVSRLAMIVVAVLTGTTLAGIGGLVASVTVVAVLGLAARSDRLWSVLLLSALVVPAFGAYVFRPWGGAGAWAGDWAWPSYLVAAACAGLLILAGEGRAPRRALRRMPGSSTNR